MKNCQDSLISIRIINRIKKLLYIKLGLNVIIYSSRRLILQNLGVRPLEIRYFCSKSSDIKISFSLVFFLSVME
jgi:hypothetical protein